MFKNIIMKRMYYLSLASFFIVFSAFKSDKPAYFLYNKQGKTVKYEKMMKDLEDADIVLFGESHDNPIAHWLELVGDERFI